jgi:hypothetical protein
MIQVIEQQKGIDESFQIIQGRFQCIISMSKIGNIFKVGLTNRPNRRRYGHQFPRWVTNPAFLMDIGLNPEDYAQPQSWKEMHLIFESGDLQSVRRVEADLISLCKPLAGYAGRTCWNLVGGGGGPRSYPGEKGTYYVYVLLG